MLLGMTKTADKTWIPLGTVLRRVAARLATQRNSNGGVHLRDVPPGFATPDVVDHPLTDAALRSDDADGAAVKPDGDDLLLSEFCPTVAGALGCNVAPLRHHVGHVVLARSEKEMGRLNTAAIVASMTNEDAFRDRTARQLVRDSMGARRLPIYTDRTVTIGEKRPRPNETAEWLSNVIAMQAVNDG